MNSSRGTKYITITLVGPGKAPWHKMIRNVVGIKSVFGPHLDS